MGERLSSWSPSCNGFIHVRLSGDAPPAMWGQVLREALTALREQLEKRLKTYAAIKQVVFIGQ